MIPGMGRLGETPATLAAPAASTENRTMLRQTASLYYFIVI